MLEPIINILWGAPTILHYTRSCSFAEFSSFYSLPFFWLGNWFICKRRSTRSLVQTVDWPHPLDTHGQYCIRVLNGVIGWVTLDKCQEELYEWAVSFFGREGGRVCMSSFGFCFRTWSLERDAACELVECCWLTCCACCSLLWPEFEELNLMHACEQCLLTVVSWSVLNFNILFTSVLSSWASTIGRFVCALSI